MTTPRTSLLLAATLLAACTGGDEAPALEPSHAPPAAALPSITELRGPYTVHVEEDPTGAWHGVLATTEDATVLIRVDLDPVTRKMTYRKGSGEPATAEAAKPETFRIAELVDVLVGMALSDSPEPDLTVSEGVELDNNGCDGPAGFLTDSCHGYCCDRHDDCYAQAPGGPCTAGTSWPLTVLCLRFPFLCALGAHNFYCVGCNLAVALCFITPISGCQPARCVGKTGADACAMPQNGSGMWTCWPGDTRTGPFCFDDQPGTEICLPPNAGHPARWGPPVCISPDAGGPPDSGAGGGGGGGAGGGGGGAGGGGGGGCSSPPICGIDMILDPATCQCVCANGAPGSTCVINGVQGTIGSDCQCTTVSVCTNQCDPGMILDPSNCTCSCIQGPVGSPCEINGVPGTIGADCQCTAVDTGDCFDPGERYCFSSHTCEPDWFPCDGDCGPGYESCDDPDCGPCIPSGCLCSSSGGGCAHGSDCYAFAADAVFTQAVPYSAAWCLSTPERQQACASCGSVPMTCSNSGAACTTSADCGVGHCTLTGKDGQPVECGGSYCGVCADDRVVGCAYGPDGDWACSTIGIFPDLGLPCSRGQTTGACLNAATFHCRDAQGGLLPAGDADCATVTLGAPCAQGAGHCASIPCSGSSDVACGEKRCGTDWATGARCDEDGDCGSGTCRAGSPNAGASCSSDANCGNGLCPADASTNAGKACTGDAACNAGNVGECANAPAGTTSCRNDQECGKCYRCTAGAQYDAACDGVGQPCGPSGTCELDQDRGCTDGWQCGSDGRCPVTGLACAEGTACGFCQFNSTLACSAIGAADPACGGKRCSNSPNVACSSALDCGGGSCVADLTCDHFSPTDPNAASACVGHALGQACHMNGATADGWCRQKSCSGNADCTAQTCQSGPLAGHLCGSDGDCGAGVCQRRTAASGAIGCSGSDAQANTQCGVCSNDPNIGCFYGGAATPSWDCGASGKFAETNLACTQGQTGGYCMVNARYTCSAGSAYDAQCRTGTVIPGTTACGPNGVCYSPPASTTGNDTACGELRCGANWATGAPCNEGADCGAGTCKAGSANAGASCLYDSQCGGGVCPAAAGGGACTTDAQCNAAGSGSCAIGGSGGGACTADSQCGTCASDPTKGCAGGFDCNPAGVCPASVTSGDKTCTAAQSCGKCPSGARCTTPGLPDASCGATVCSNNQNRTCDPTDVTASCGAGTCKAELECADPTVTSLADRRALCKGKAASAQCKQFLSGSTWMWATCQMDAGGQACSGNEACETATCTNAPATLCDLNEDGVVTGAETTQACGGMCTYKTGAGASLGCHAVNDCGVCKRSDGTLSTPMRGCQANGQCVTGETCWFPNNSAITTCGVDPAKTCTTTPNVCQGGATCAAPICQNGGGCLATDTCQVGTDKGGECSFTYQCESGKNWARPDLGAVASQSSTAGSATAARAVDGALATSSATNSQAGAWWQVNLGAVRSVDTIKIYGGSLAPLTGYQILIDPTDCAFDGDSAVVATNPGRALSPSVAELAARPARCIRVALTGTGVLDIAEVEVLESQCAFSGSSACAPPPVNPTTCTAVNRCTSDPGQTDSCVFANDCAQPANACTTPRVCAFPTCLGDGVCQPGETCEPGSSAGGECDFPSPCAAPAGDCLFPPSSRCRPPDCQPEQCATTGSCLLSPTDSCAYAGTCGVPASACAP